MTGTTIACAPSFTSRSARRRASGSARVITLRRPLNGEASGALGGRMIQKRCPDVRAGVNGWRRANQVPQIAGTMALQDITAGGIVRVGLGGATLAFAALGVLTGDARFYLAS